MEGPMVLPRAFAILRLLAQEPHGINLSGIAQALDAPKSSLSSTLKALTDQTYLSRRGTLYFLGPEAYALASVILAGRTIRQIARPHLERALAATNETVLLAQLDPDGQHISYIDTVEPDKSVRFSVAVGTRRSLYSTAVGHVFLAHMSPTARQDYYAGARLDSLTDSTVTDPAALEEIVQQVRRVGVAVTFGSCYAEAAGISCPIFNAEGEVVAAVVIGVPVSRAQQGTTLFTDAARQAAADISQILGYRPDKAEARQA